MKALVFYITAIVTMVLPFANLSLSWFFLCIADFMLLIWCRENITFRELLKYSGYSIWYKLLKTR